MIELDIAPTQIFKSMKSYIICKNNFGKRVKIDCKKFFFRPSAYGIILYKGKIVVLRNKSNGKAWFPGGGVNVGEKLEMGLKREIKEETGLRVRIEKLVLVKENYFYYQPLDEAYHAFLFFYLCKPLSTKIVSDENVKDLESEKPRWVNIGEIKKDDISDLKEDLFSIICDLK